MEIIAINSNYNHFYCSDHILTRLETCRGLIKDELKSIKNCSVAFPDEGAHKRYHRIFKEFPKIICTKVSDGNKRVVTLKGGEAKNRNIVFVDDLVQTGGTLCECGLLTQSNGCDDKSQFGSLPAQSISHDFSTEVLTSYDH